MRDKNLVVWVIAGLVLAVVLNLPAIISKNLKSGVREGLAPIQGSAAAFSRRFRETIEAVRGIGDVVAENRTMSGELVRLKDEVLRLKNLERENLELRQVLQFEQEAQRSLLPCEIIARDMSGWWRTLRLSKGSADGITVNMAVITPDGLVGKTIAVSPNTADVLLISDPSCKVSTQITRAGLFGITSGRGTGRDGRVYGQVDFINKDKQVRVGDELITSGLGGVFPKGLLIGYIESIELDESGLYQVANFVPKAELGGMRYVFVVVDAYDPIQELLRKKGLRRRISQ